MRGVYASLKFTHRAGTSGKLPILMPPAVNALSFMMTRISSSQGCVDCPFGG